MGGKKINIPQNCPTLSASTASPAASRYLCGTFCIQPVQYVSPIPGSPLLGFMSLPQSLVYLVACDKRGPRKTRLTAPACGRLFTLPKSWSINGKGNMFHLRKIQTRCQAQVIFFLVAPRGIQSCPLNPPSLYRTLNRKGQAFSSPLPPLWLCFCSKRDSASQRTGEIRGAYQEASLWCT